MTIRLLRQRSPRYWDFPQESPAWRKEETGGWWQCPPRELISGEEFATVANISDHLVGETRAEAVIGTCPKTA